MNSRELILQKVKQNQPKTLSALPSLEKLGVQKANLLEEYKTVLKGIGGNAVEVKNYDEIISYIKDNYDTNKRIITTIPELSAIASLDWFNDDPHTLENVELNIFNAHFGVAENSALWVTDKMFGQRISAFIPQYLAIVVNKKDIVQNMHEAYTKIGNQEYNFASFIAGPSKTADIEQSLVLGAHGARSLIVFMID
jgi:L-lactate dehydrogenase complex protein LldG